MQLFKKLFVCTDQHIGRKNGNIIDLKDSTNFFDWAIDEALTWGAETCLLGGDFFDNRHQIGLITLDTALTILDKLSSSFQHVYILLGNHDLPYKTQRTAASIEIARNYKNITIIRKPIKIGETILLPWLLEDEFHLIKSMKGKYIFGHAEIPGFYFNSKIVMAETEEAVQAVDFDADYTFMGHFHSRQWKSTKNGEIIYLGANFPYDYSDSNETERGIMLLEYGKEPIFRTWTDQPLYKTATLTQILSDPNVLKQNMSVRVSIDTPLRYEEQQEIKKTLMSSYGLRKFEMLNGVIEEQMFTEEMIEYKNVDQIVLEGLASVDSIELSNATLIKIYNELVG